MKILIIFNFCLILQLNAAPKDDIKAHVLQAQIIHLFSGVPASIQLAQAYCETKFGQAQGIGTDLNNVFAIMDFPNDYWEFGNKKLLGAYGRNTYTWRDYIHPIISWIDHAYFFTVHAKKQLGKDWKFWCSNPPKYSNHKDYWPKIKRTILKYKLYQYD